MPLRPFARPRRRPPAPRARALAAATAAVALLGCLFVVGAGSAQGVPAGTVLLQDDFTTGTTTGTSYVVGGRSFTPCLTAGTSTTSTPVRGCGAGADAPGSGALRLTQNVNNQAGFLLYNKALPTKAGLDITFNEYQWGGTKADGISFFLTDGAYTLDAVGAYGGSLGYHNNSSQDGVAHALLGIGLDVYGNYTVETNDIATCGSTYKNTSLQPNTVAVRGPGNLRTGYCLLGPVASANALKTRLTPDTGRPAAVAVRVVVDPPTDASPKVTVYLNGTSVTSVPEPAALGTTPTFKFGWAASTGGQNDYHEVNFLAVKSVNPLLSDLALASSATTVPSGDSATVTLTARTDAASGPVPAGQPVTISATAPAGTTLGTPTGTGWDCTTSNGTALSCTATSAAAIDPGTTLAPVTVGITRTTAGVSGTSTLTATVASPQDDATLLANNVASATVKWSPVASAVAGSPVLASPSPSGVSVDPAVVGTGPYTFAVTSTTSALGTVSVSGQQLVVTPVAGASGVVRGTYQPTDADGVPGNAAAVTLTVAPIAAAGSITTDAGHAGSVTLAVPTGTGPFTAAVTSASAGLSAASVAVDGTGHPVLAATPTAGFSGDAAVTYRVVDASGVPSADVTVPVHVRPVASDDALTLALDAGGAASLTTALPSGTGTGPLTYALVGDGDLGGATVTLASDGTISVVADTGVSGTYTVPYTVSDTHGTSTQATVSIAVHPYLGAIADVAGTADSSATSAAPAYSGSRPVTWQAGTAPTGTTVTVGAGGAVTLDPHGHSGRFVVSLTATDPDALASGTQTVTFVVAPVTAALSADADASATPAGTALTPAPVGTGPYTVAVVAGLAPGQGTVAVVGTHLVVTPAAGVSGVLAATYSVTDAAGVTSAAAPVVLRVRPVALAASARVPSGSTRSVVLPDPVGTGPFTWTVASVDTPAAGTFTIRDGVATLVAASTYSGPVVVRYTVTDADGLESAEALLTVTVDPVAPSGGSGTTAVQPGTSGDPVAGPVPAPTGSGPFRYAIVTGPTPEQGTATIDPDTGVVTFSPAPGFSGPVDVQYQATDVHGTPAAPANVTFEIAPLAAPTAGAPTGTPGAPLRTDVGTAVTTPLPTPVGTGPFTYELVSGPTAGEATVTIDPRSGALTVVPASGYSGTLEVQYRVLDSSGLASDPVPYRIDVAPTVPGDPSTTTTPGTTTTVALPEPQGSGPFTWTLVAGPGAGHGTATIDPATGRLTFVAAPGWTGTARITYTVTDADGVTSEALAYEVDVRAALAETGASVGPWAAAAALLVALGAALVLAVRRRQA